jgi:branched-chain amino acid transport system ATP-binding protein/urea transport system ATP-binding protein
MKCIAGALVPDAGTIRFAGRDITTTPPAERARAGLSIKFQITSVLPALSVYDNILLALQAQSSLKTLIWSATRRALHERVLAALDDVALLDRADNLAGVLSHGEQQWLEIGMVIAQDPELLLVDEPVAGMTDEETERTGELLESIASDRSVLVIEHDMEFVRQIARQVTVLHQGTVLCEGPVEQVQNDPRVLEVYLGRKREGADAVH